MYRGIIFIIIIIAIPGLSFGQHTASVNGFVKDQTSGETLIMAHIVLKDNAYRHINEYIRLLHFN